MRPRRAADHLPSSSAAVMKEQSYNSTHPLGHTGPVTGSLTFTSYRYSPTHAISTHFIFDLCNFKKQKEIES